MTPIVEVELWILVVTGFFNMFAIFRVNWALYRDTRNGAYQADFFDHARREGSAGMFGAIGVSALLLLLNIGAEWRVPLAVLAGVFAAIGLQRDVRRVMKRKVR